MDFLAKVMSSPLNGFFLDILTSFYICIICESVLVSYKYFLYGLQHDQMERNNCVPSCLCGSRPTSASIIGTGTALLVMMLPFYKYMASALDVLKLLMNYC